ncbi:hypothetical protein EU546_00755 [Candidatus Thorarchaeota archaeon]|nr:MAG: hypothetical protein EU546_00755 [Candidatus Thorarchaeota archaeon]
MGSEEMNREIERAIVRSFGWAVIEFEAALFQKFLVVSGPTSLMTEDMFRRRLKDMEAKGYLTPVEFQGKRAWKRLIIESEMDEPELTADEVKAFLEKAKAMERVRPEKKTGDGLVSESRALATQILRSVEKAIRPSPKRVGTPSMIDHIEGMRHALAESREGFLEYVRKNLPRLYTQMGKLLDDNGEEMLLLSLRVIESGHRTYPPQ